MCSIAQTGELLSANNYINITWATHVDMETGRPVEVPEARYKNAPFLLYPSYLGGHNWHPMSYSPQTGLVYIPVLDIPAMYGQPAHFKYNPGVGNTGTDGVIGGLPDEQAERDAIGALVKGRLLAWDPVKQQEAWRVEHKGPWNGGTLTTAGNLVFQGTADGKLVAYRADNGAATVGLRHPDRRGGAAHFAMNWTANSTFPSTWAGAARSHWCSANMCRPKACPMSAAC